MFVPHGTEDDTYVEHQEDLEEYLLSDRGVVWRGNNRQPLPTFWDYGQVITCMQGHQTCKHMYTVHANICMYIENH